MRLRRIIFSLIIVAILWSCSSYVRFTSEDLDDIKTYGNMIYDGSKQIIEELEARLQSENRGNKFEGKLLQASKEWLGTPYLYGGTTHDGIDCSGFVLNVYNELGYEVPRTSRQQYKYTTRVSSNEKRVGDLVFFRRGNRVGHVGIYIGHNKMIHASTSRGVIIQDLDNDYLQRTFAGFGRVER